MNSNELSQKLYNQVVNGTGLVKIDSVHYIVRLALFNTTSRKGDLVKQRRLEQESKVTALDKFKGFFKKKKSLPKTNPDKFDQGYNETCMTVLDNTDLIGTGTDIDSKLKALGLQPDNLRQLMNEGWKQEANSVLKQLEKEPKGSRFSPFLAKTVQSYLRRAGSKPEDIKTTPAYLEGFTSFSEAAAKVG